VTRVDVTAPATVDGAYFDIDGNGVVKNSGSKITLNEDKSPQLQPGGCVAVLLVIKTNDVAPHSTVTMNLAVRSNAANAANGRGEDIGTIINTVGEGPRLTDPNNPNLQPSNLIDGKSEVVLSSGAIFTNSTEFKRSGDADLRLPSDTQRTAAPPGPTRR